MDSEVRASDAQSLKLTLAPWLFILVWACGYIVAKYATPYAPPLTFLSLRFAGCIALMAVLAWYARAALPRGAAFWHTAVAGVLIHFGYLAGCWMGIAQGMPAGVAALIVNMQPVLTALFAYYLGEQVTRRQWLGLVVGFAGVAMVLSTKLGLSNAASFGWAATALMFGALFSMTVGTLYQKRFCPGLDLRASQVVQFGASLLVSAPLAWGLETQPVLWTVQLWGALLFSIFILSGVGITLFLWLIQRGQATRVTGYMYWVPPVSSLMAWQMFGEQLSAIALCGFAAVALGVYWVTHIAPNTSKPPNP